MEKYRTEMNDKFEISEFARTTSKLGQAVYEKMVKVEFGILENIDAVMKLRHNPEELNNMVLPEK
jgi:hypothetical protein